MNLQQVANALGIPAPQIVRLHNEGVLPVIRIDAIRTDGAVYPAFDVMDVGKIELALQHVRPFEFVWRDGEHVASVNRELTQAEFGVLVHRVKMNRALRQLGLAA